MYQFQETHNICQQLVCIFFQETLAYGTSYKFSFTTYWRGIENYWLHHPNTVWFCCQLSSTNAMLSAFDQSSLSNIREIDIYCNACYTLSLMQSGDIYLEAQIQNITPSGIYLEKVLLEPAPQFNSDDLSQNNDRQDCYEIVKSEEKGQSLMR